MTVKTKKENDKLLVIIGGGYKHEMNSKVLAQTFYAARGDALTLTGDWSEDRDKKNREVLAAMDLFLDSLTKKQEELYRSWNGMKNNNGDAYEKELFLQGFFTGLRQAAELLLRDQLNNLDTNRESATTG